MKHINTGKLEVSFNPTSVIDSNCLLNKHANTNLK